MSGNGKERDPLNRIPSQGKVKILIEDFAI